MKLVDYLMDLSEILKQSSRILHPAETQGVGTWEEGWEGGIVFNE